MPLRLTEAEALELLADHYARMAKNPASVDYARARVMELMKDPLFKDLGKMVKERLNAPSSQG